MVFASYLFLFVFLPAWWAVDVAIKGLAPAAVRNDFRLAWLVVASAFFYGVDHPWYVGLLGATALLDWIAATRIRRAESARLKSRWLLASIGVNVALLAFFKFRGLAFEGWNTFAAAVGAHDIATPLPGIEMPIGVSFYTFQSLSFVIDAARGAPATGGPGRFLAYVIAFPQLVAGPVVRYREVADDLARDSRRLEDVALGALRFMCGLAKKMLIADPAGILADEWLRLEQPGLIDAWAGALAFRIEIYFDFSGYSDMAIGLGALCGLRLPENFNSPMRATTAADVWRRWHITLSTWFRDYVYIPLGGNRGTRARVVFNLSVTLILAGLWHGGTLPIVLYGVWNAVFVTAERLAGMRPPTTRTGKALGGAYVWFFLLLGGVFFAAPDVATLGRLLSGLCGANGVGDFTIKGMHSGYLPHLAVMVGVGIVLLAPTAVEFWRRPTVSRINFAFAVFFLAVIQLFHAEQTPFIYFRF